MIVYEASSGLPGISYLRLDIRTASCRRVSGLVISGKARDVVIQGRFGPRRAPKRI